MKKSITILALFLISFFTKAQSFIANPIISADENERKANELFITTNDQYNRNEFDDAISNLHKILLLTKDSMTIAYVFNNLGYYNLRLENYEESVRYFKSCIQIQPYYGNAIDNLAYTFIKLGNLADAKELLTKASQSGSNELSYTYRNFALYYQSKNEFELAEEFFKKAFDSTKQVELLEYHYAIFLFEKGDKDKGLKYLEIAVKKGEPEAIKKMNDLKKN